MRQVLIFPFFVLFMHVKASENREIHMSRKVYLETWKATALRQQSEYHIPASITMAQAILESGSGNSELAKKANNHFGIKCHDWKGATIYMDDDSKGECFRVYPSPEESFKDHSVFLSSKSRYASLFQLPMNDYKSWAKGLKDAGYATNPQYPDLLVGLIEELKLNELDEKQLTPLPVPELIVSNNEYFKAHKVVLHENKVKYVFARKGDTYVRIAKEFNLGLWQLYRYNDRDPKKDCLSDGDIVYLQPKRKRSRVHEFYSVKTQVTLSQIAQMEAVSVKSLLKLNKDITSEFQLIKSGSKVVLR